MEKDRASLYRFLSIGFTYPEDNYSEIIEKAIELVNPSYSNLNKNGYKISGIRDLKKGLKELKSLKFEEWQGIYTSLFISNYPKTPLHPYESFYKEGIISGATADRVNELYQSCGLEIFDEREFPDYLIFELEFAAFLIENSEGCKPIIKEFFVDHLFSWIFNFFDDVIKYEQTPLFYRALSKIGETFLVKEKKNLEVLNE
ncbi:TorD/DmsD family molecular chaperone [Hippea jasoniae]|uniref:TorD/DmsD family molecular chaperone n=1 Tax=Hippea jasoniae TaxID=944479 RepID=UPI00068B906A|nr:molecular chaperone TorD family protein [Hippea jasoniae]